MPVVAIPFKAPAPFDIPGSMAEPIRRAPRETAGAQALELLAQVDAGAAMAIGWVEPDGRLAAGPSLAGSPAASEALSALGQAPAPFLSRAVEEGRPLLFMGELGADDADPTFPAAFRQYLLGGAAQAGIGFLYVFPLIAPDGAVRGTLMIHRALPEGPLNHDQPAIAHALAHLLGEAASSR